jgi:transposase
MSYEPTSRDGADRAEQPGRPDSAVAAGLQSIPEEKPKPRLKPINRQQLILRTVDIEQLVAEDHAVRAIWELVGQLDLSPYYEQIRAVEGVAGREPVDPQLLLSLWIYAYSKGVSSAREIARLCEHHPAYQWLTGMEVINHHTLSDFRVDHRQALDELFTEVLGLLSSEGLITLERVMQDGTKIKACAGADTFRREQRLQSHLEMARQQVAAMGDPRSAEEVSPRVRAARQRAAREKRQRLELALRELEKIRASKSGAEAKAEARASHSDPEARVMKQSDGGWAPSYNLQLTTDAAAGVIVGVAVSQSGSDYEQLVPAVDRLAEQFGQAPAQVVADGGFTSRPNIMDLDQRGVDFIGSMGDGAAQSAGQMDRRGVDPAFRPEAFSFEAASDTYTCPSGKTLRYESKEERPGRTNYQYRAKAADCQACPLKAKCCPHNAAKGRMIVRGVDHPVVAAFNEKMQTEAAQQIYKQRGALAEFPHAWIKDKLGLRQFRLRGLIKVGREALWACLTYNIQQWIRLRWRLRWAENRA